jgi:hypothetical protein
VDKVVNHRLASREEYVQFASRILHGSVITNVLIPIS